MSNKTTETKSDDFSVLWPRELIRDISRKHDQAQQSFDALKSPDTSYGLAHQLMLQLYDAALSAISAELALSALSSFPDSTKEGEK